MKARKYLALLLVLLFALSAAACGKPQASGTADPGASPGTTQNAVADTPEPGAPDYNMALSERRAEAVARELARHGLTYGSIIRRGFGSMRPIADNATPAGRAQNRRVAIIVPAA